MLGILPRGIPAQQQRRRCCTCAAADQNGGSLPPPPGALAPRWLPAPPALRGTPARSWSPASLAYLGDCVWELYTRRHFFAPASLHSTYVAKVSQVTRAEGQAAALAGLVAAGSLTPAELAVLKWGRNATTGKVPERLRGNGGVYREATALEVLCGLLYVTEPARLDEIMALIGWEADKPAAG